MMKFEITDKDNEKIKQWLRKEVWPEILKEQKKDPEISHWIMEDSGGYEMPYTGTLGAELTYEFTPTSLGDVVRVSAWGKTLDLTDYESW